jgi:coenzyme F420-reducing hydrogenase delta subunit/Pyruvate/2-oxoacid:ferredoxin oxidoreductase delta subunit
VALWLPLTERLPPGVVWTAMLAAALAAVLVPRLTRRPREGRLHPSVVDPRLCTGCNQCPQDCPWEAITMVPREDDRPTLLARVDPARCVSCGICAGSCAPMGIGPPGRSGRDQLAAIRTLSWFAGTNRASVVAFCCEQAPPGHLAALRARGATVHPVSCVGALHTSVIELALRNGAAGVMVCGCPPRDCANREGPKWLRERVLNGREAELQPRVDRKRVRLATLAPGDLAGAIEAYDAFARSVAAIGHADPSMDPDAELACDAQAAGGAATP